VLQALVPAGWKWGQAYTIAIDADAHTLAGDEGHQCEVHRLCQEAKADGDPTYGVEQAVIFRLHREGMSETVARQQARHPSWSAGRESFDQHRDGPVGLGGDVPFISGRHNISREPFRYSLNLSNTLPHADRYPMEMAFTNFLYWHTRKNDVVLVLGDKDDIFGTTAAYCGRRVLIAPFHETGDNDDTADELLRITTAYVTLGTLVTHGGMGFFQNYPQDALFATISMLVRNMRDSLVDATGILFSQTAGFAERFTRTTDFVTADLATPCEMV
jgi:hypothetical protein